MEYSSQTLKEKLSYLSQAEMISLVVKLYQDFPNVRNTVGLALVSENETHEILGNLVKYTPGECKTALSKRIKTIKDKREKVLFYFAFVETVLDNKDSLDHRFISVASSTYGKAMDLLSKDKPLWDELLDKSYEIAGCFYEIEGMVAYNAVDYYTRVKRNFDKQETENNDG